MSTDLAKSIIAWAWTQHQAYRDRYEGAMTDPAWAELTFLRLRSVSDADELLSSVGKPVPADSDGARPERSEDGWLP